MEVIIEGEGDEERKGGGGGGGGGKGQNSCTGNLFLRKPRTINKLCKYI